MYEKFEIGKIIEEYGIPDPSEIPETLFHYTSQTGFKGIIENRELWATHIRYLNDSQEFEFACSYLKEILDKYASEYGQRTIDYIKESIGSFERVNICVSSFSKKRDDLSQWRAYSHLQIGYAIGFSLSFLKRICTKNKFLITKCIYDRATQKQMLEKAVKQQIDACGINSSLIIENLKLILGILGPICKDPNFVDEDEIRIITTPRYCDREDYDFREGKSSLIPFCKIKLDIQQISKDFPEIIVGPTPEPLLALSAANSFIYRHWEGLRDRDIVKNSSIPFRSWN